MKTVKNIIDKNAVNKLKKLIGKRFSSYSYDHYFDDKNIANPAGIECYFEDQELIITSDIKFFDFLDGEDYSFFSILDDKQPEFQALKQYPKKEQIIVNQIIQDIQIITDTYHCTSTTAKIDSLFASDYALIFVLERNTICFEKFDIFETEIIIHNIKADCPLHLFDNSSDFDDDELFSTTRKRVIQSIKDSHA
jgi:hypothetical protein